MFVDIEIYKGDDNIFVAACPELNLFSHAENQYEAVEKLKKSILEFMKNSEKVSDPSEDIEFSIRHYPSRYPQVH